MDKKKTKSLASVTVAAIVISVFPKVDVKASAGDVNRIPGKDRYETAANVAMDNWKDGAENVIIASGEGYADALSASILSRKINAPIILTKSGELHKSAKEALKTLKSKNVYIIGGNACVSQSIRNELKDEGYDLTELGGKNRFETNIAIANHLVEKHGVKADEILVVNGAAGLADALSVAPVAAAKEQILLIVGKDVSTADLASKFVEKHNSQVTVVGTEVVVPKAISNKLGAKERVKGGANRFETNLNIMKHFKLKSEKIYIANATGDSYADALVASVVAGKTGCQLILTDRENSAVTKNVMDHIASIKNDKTEVKLVGGDYVIPKEIEEKIKEVVNQENTDKPNNPEKPNKPENPEEPGNTGNSGNTGSSGNTGNTQRPVEKDKFEILWSFADVDEDLDVNTTNGKDDGNYDYVYIKFNKPVSTTGEGKNALNISNYKLNGKPLPKGTKIKADIEGFDDGDKVTDSITIMLPNQYLEGKNEPHKITISSYLESTTTGDVLTNGGDKTLTWSVVGREVFNASFAAEKQVYEAEAAAKKDLALKDNLINAEKALEKAKSSVKFLQDKTSKKSALQERVNATEKTVKDARKKFDEKINKDFEFSNGKITKYTGDKTDIVIPDTINGEKVTAIGNGAFAKKNLISVKIPETVESIEMQAFAMNSLTAVELPENLKDMGNIAFMGNKLKSIKIPGSLTIIPASAFNKNEITSVVISEGVTEIASSAFMNNKIESIVIPSSLKNIRAKAFSNNNLKSVTIPKNVKDITENAFEKNKDLKLTYSKLVEAIEVAQKIKTEGKEEDKVKVLKEVIEKGNDLNKKPDATLKDVNKVAEDIDKAIEALIDVKSFEFSNGKITKYTGTETDIVIPSTINGEKVTAIGNGVFSKKGLTSIKLPNSIKEIGATAFARNNLKVIEIPEELETIGMGAFMGNKLEKLNLPDSVTSISTRAFMSNELTSIKLPKNIEIIESYVFNDNKLTSITIPQTIKIIRGGSFQKNNLQSVVIPSIVEEIEAKAFDSNTKLVYKGEKAVFNSIKPVDDVVVALGTSEIDAKGRLPKKVVILDSKDKEHYADVNWKISKYNSKIEGQCEATGTIILPKDVMQLNSQEDLKVSIKIKVVDNKWETKDFTFNGTIVTGFSQSGKDKFKNNKDLIIPSTNEKGEVITEIGDKAFSTELKTYGGKDTLKDKDSAKQDPKIALHSVRIPNTVKIIGKEAFRHNLLTNVELPKGLTSIKMLAFNNNKLQKLVIPDSVTEVQNGAFTYNNIDDLTLSKNLKTIEVAFAFNNLKVVTIPEGVIKISDRAFSDNAIEKVNIPSTLKYLSGFNNNNFKSITIPKNVEELGLRAFERNKIESVVIPGNVKKIGESSFGNTWHDTFLTSVTIEEGVEVIDKYAFSQDHLKDVQIPSSIKSIADNSFSKNLGHDGVVHLFTPDYKNPNNLKEAKYHVINPAKLTIKYVFGDKVLKEEETWKNKTTGEYLHIGDKDVEVTPNYLDNEYELADSSVRKINLDKKENAISIECKKKQVADKITIKSIGEVAPAVVDLGTDQNVAINKLPKDTYIIDSNGKDHQVQLTWSIKNYAGNTPGEYTAIGTFKLPQGVAQSQPETTLEVKGRIVVKEAFDNIQNSNWKVEDFNFEGTVLAGFSDKGTEKLKTNKDLVLPKVNDKGEAITKVKNYVFAKKGLTSVAIPEGLSGLVIGTNAFEENEISKVYISEGVKEIDAYAFSKNKLKYVDFPGTLKKIGNNAFAENQLVSAVFSKDVSKIAIDRFSFYKNEITSITLVNDVTKVNGEAFKENKAYNIDGKVHIFTKSFDPDNCNQWFPNSKYHKIIPLNN